MKRRFFFLWLLLIAWPALAQPLASDAPRRQMVVASHPLASEAGMAMLRAGGTALDAAIAVQAVLTLVEPQSSGIGGGAFLLHFDGQRGTTQAWDGRETAPAGARGDLFMQNGQPMPFAAAVVGGRSVGVPGVLRMLEAAHRQHGALPWAQLMQPAITLAEQGFAVSERLSQAIELAAANLRRDARLAALYLQPDGTALPPGSILRNPALAATLRAVAEQGADALHRGPIAAEIAMAIRSHPNAGLMTADDLAGYEPLRREPLCRPYRQWTICVPPPPSGGLVVLQIMGLLEHTAIGQLPAGSAEAAMLLGDAGRLAFADRNRFLADPADLPVPVEGLLDPAYLLLRAQALQAGRGIAEIRHGNPRMAPPRATQPPQPEAGTAHLSVVDSRGNAVAMTTTVEGNFGAHIGVGGFVLNNELTDFSFRPEIDGFPVANRVAGGKRPRSSMSPALVFDAQGRLAAITGSPGGARIIGYVAQSLVALLDWSMEPALAAALPHVGPMNNAVELEEGTAVARLAAMLQERGLPVVTMAMPSGLNLIRIHPGTPPVVSGAADPRREGLVVAD